MASIAEVNAEIYLIKSIKKAKRQMKVIIFGSRPPEEIRNLFFTDYSRFRSERRRWEEDNYPLIERGVRESGLVITEVVSGCAQGFDKLGETWCRLHLRKDATHFPANWQRHGRKAGYMRNADMALYANAGIGFWDKKSRGTANMIELLKQAEKPVHIHYI